MSTGNNRDVNYLVAKYSDDIANPSWNPNGTGEFSFVNCSVTAVVDEIGYIITDPKKDAIIGLPIVTNPSMVPAKLVDLDSPHYDLSSTVYGMKFGVNWKPNSKNSFIGEWVPATVSRDIWGRQIKNKLSDPMVQPIATQGSSRLTNIVWRDIEKSPILTKLHSIGDSLKLSVSVSLYLYTRPGKDVKFTYGNVSGTIGVASNEEPLNFVGDRVLLYNENFPGDTMTLPNGDSNLCKGEKTWMSTAYFNINRKPELTATVDFGNSIKIDPQGELCDFGNLYLAVIIKTVPKTVQVIRKIDYKNPNWYAETAGLNDFLLHSDHNDELPFAVVTMAGIDSLELSTHTNYPVCTATPAQNSQDSRICVFIVMEESRFNLRPMDHHVYRLEAGNDEEDKAVLRLRLRDYGKVPSTPLSVKLIPINNSPETMWNEKYLSVEHNPIETSDDGIAIFNFKADKSVGQPRKELGMDGIVQTLGYCVTYKDEANKDIDVCETTYTNQISFLVWDKTEYNEPIFWDEHIKPIFLQYERLYPAMRHILRLGEYEDIVKYQNIQLLKKAMDAKNYDHASYMPVSRDLSPSRRDMIIKWLNSPDHYRNWSHVQEVHYTPPEFCKNTNYELAKDQQSKGGELFKKMSLRGDEMLMKHFRLLSKTPSDINTGDQPFWFAEARENKHCTVPMLRRYLQKALVLEYSTIPPYLTAMYSIKAGENGEVYDVIRSVVMQEMLHMAQVANILIALGGRPIIDDKKYVPSYPGKLPAHVLPGLTVSLKKASPKHIYEVFMMIEYPHGEKDSGLDEDVEDQLTIGMFYKRIEECIKIVGDGVFCENNPKCEAMQLVWPWKVEHSSGTLHKVKDVKSALNAIDMIVEQGEGAGKQDPTYLDTKWLAHFYKFEELACKKRLHVKHKHDRSENFGFSNKEDIEFTADGVWPMRDNPSKEGIPYGTQVYHKARHFHAIYRSFLVKLQEVFDGNPDSIDDAVYLMESLQLHMKELMMLEIPSPPGWPKRTCGPVFDYDWE